MSDEIDTPSASKRQRHKGRRKPRIGEKGIRYGDRNFLLTAGQGLIAQDGVWHLVAVPSWEREGWHNFKLYFDQKAPKNLFNISVSKNGVYARRDTLLLQEHYPDRLDWFELQANRYIRGEIHIVRERGQPIKYGKGGWRKINKEQG